MLKKCRIFSLECSHRDALCKNSPNPDFTRQDRLLKTWKNIIFSVNQTGRWVMFLKGTQACSLATEHATSLTASYIYSYFCLWIMSFFCSMRAEIVYSANVIIEPGNKCQQSCAASCLFTKAQMTGAPQLLPLLVSNLTSNVSYTPPAFFLFLFKPN